MQTVCRATIMVSSISVKSARMPTPATVHVAPRPRIARLAPMQALPGTSGLPSVPGDKDDLPGYLAVAGLAVQQLSKSRFAMTPELLYSSLAVYSLVYTVLSVVNGKFEADRVGNVVAPAFLASAALGFFNGHLTPFQTAAAAFGYFLSQGLPGPLPLWLASLGYAIYSNHAAEWAVAAFGLSAAYGVFEAVKNKAMPKPQQVAFLAVAGWAFYAQTTEMVALLIFGGHVLASTVT